MKHIHLFQFGKGNIGGALIAQIIRQKKTLADRYGIRLEYVGCCGRSHAVIDPDRFDRMLQDHTIDQLLSQHKDRLERPDPQAVLDELMRLSLPNPMVIDTTAAELTDAHLTCLRRGIPVITANKKPVADAFPLYAELQRLGRGEHMRYWYETTAGAGLPVIGTLREMVMTGDSVLEITGCLSGTLGYICSQLDMDRAFSDIVRDARAQGYTEPDPRDDLNGMDVARKALILAREIGHTLDIEDIRVERMISDELEQIDTVEAFMDHLKVEDKRYAQRVADSRARGEVLRYMATVREGGCDVALERVPASSPAGSLSGPDNLVTIKTARYHDAPMVIRGPGAGADVTAAGLFGDIIKAACVV